MHSRCRSVTFAALLSALVATSSAARAQTPPAPAPAPAPGGWTTSPARAADPELGDATAPAAQPPLSTSGTEVTPQTPLMPPAPVVVADKGAEDSRARIRELEARLALDEAKLKTLEDDLGFLRHLKVQGFIQLQYRVQDVNEPASPNLIDGRLPEGIGPNSVIARPDGTTTNTSAFRLRRTRLRVIHETDVTRFFLQLDAAPIGGPSPGTGTIARNAEATGIAHWTKKLKTEFTGGLFMVPFLRELPEASMYRPFIERTWAAQNLFPTERDLGVHINTMYEDKLALDIGVINGQRLGESRFFAVPDLNRSKDFFASLQLGAGPMTFSVHGYAGSNAIVDKQNLRVKNFSRYAANFAVTFTKTLAPKLGETRAQAEVVIGQNMDTGVNYAFALPVIGSNFAADVRDIGQRSVYLRLEQDVTRWAIGGFRYETYTPNTSLKNNARDTYTFMAGARFSKLLRFINEVSWAIDNAHAEGSAAPSMHIFQYTGWLQGSIY